MLQTTRTPCISSYALCLLAVILLGSSSAFCLTCSDIKNTKLTKGTVTSADLIPAGSSLPPADMLPQPTPSFWRTLPTFCRVSISLRRSPESSIAVEVWMPAENWNGKFRAVGNAGFGGSIDYVSMGDSIRENYATAGTNTGHSGLPSDASWALRQTAKLEDFGYIAIHEMTLVAKTLTTDFYGQSPRHSYFLGCSNGGRQALMEAQRYPDDYDGIIAGAPANDWTHLFMAGLWDAQLMDDADSYLPPAAVKAINVAVLEKCDLNDGIRDGIITDPEDCHLSPESLICSGSRSEQCLTRLQAEALQKIYVGPHTSDGKLIFPGFSPGGEDGAGGWTTWITGPVRGGSVQSLFVKSFFGNMVFENPDWTYGNFDFDKGVRFTDSKLSAILNANDADLSLFRRHGGKLILYHGWSDPAIPPLSTINYYERVLKTIKPTHAQSFLRLYMVPGMQHCLGGPGPNVFGQSAIEVPIHDAHHDVSRALDNWVDRGIAPAEIIATKYLNDNPAQGIKMTRPLCSYPEIAKYDGKGDVSKDSSFMCKAIDKNRE